MESVQIRQRLRPLRYAMVVRHGDMDGLSRAACLNTALWGGRYNPILIADDTAGNAGLLADFDPDFLVNLTGAELPNDLAGGFHRRVLGPETFVNTDSKKTRRFVLGFNVLPLMNNIFDRDLRFAPKEETRAAIVAGVPNEWKAYSAVAFGDYSHLPESDFDFAHRFREILRGRSVPFDPENLEELVDVFSPLDLTGYRLRTLGGSASFSTHVVYIGDHRSYEDLVDYWNLRATARHVWFAPARHIRAHGAFITQISKAGHYPINDQVTNTADIQKGPSLSEQDFETACKAIASFADPMGRRTWRGRYGQKVDWYVGDIHAATLEAQSGEEIAILEGNSLTPIKLITPKFFGDDDRTYPGRFHWGVELSASDPYDRNDVMFNFPRGRAVQDVVRRSAAGMPEKVRAAGDGIVLTQDGMRESAYLRPVATRDVFYALFRDSGLTAADSQPGRYTEEIIKRMGSLHADCRVFKLQGVREVLARLSKGEVLTKGNMKGIVMSTTTGEHGVNWVPELYDFLHIRSGQQGGKPNFTDVFEILLEKRVIRPGRGFTCQTCHATEWYHVSDFDETYKCRVCFTEQRVPFGNFGEWQYKADGVFRVQHSGMGSVPVIVAMWRFAEQGGLETSRYLTSTILRDDIGWECEIDYAWLMVERFRPGHELVIGQATTFAPFTSDEVRKTRELSERLNKNAFLAFSTLNTEFSADEQQLLRQLRKEGHKVIALTRGELDPYDLSDRFKGLPNTFYSNSLKEIAAKTAILNLNDDSEPQD